MTTATVSVGGFLMNLEERTCEGGCGKKFKVLPSSTARTARRDCQAACKGSIDDAIKAMDILLKGAKKPGGPKRDKKGAAARRAKDDEETVSAADEADGEPTVDADEFELGEEAS